MTILVLDELTAVRENLIHYLELENNFDEVLRAESFKEAAEILKTKIIDVVIFDLQLADGNCFNIVKYANSLLKRPILIMCSNYNEPEYKKIYEQFPIDYCFDKTNEIKKLKRMISELAGVIKS